MSGNKHVSLCFAFNIIVTYIHVLFKFAPALLADKEFGGPTGGSEQRRSAQNGGRVAFFLENNTH